ncbi:NAD-dependent epimerase/dehydratase family protein [Lacrimispora sp.]|uniref:NAD-dependent epimerase/dehydratase family protein n=1 Tax=Lacrimispora sp. TaxID=2719234 RepID=UPI003460E0BE
MKVLVTGANGYLGQGIVKSILDKGYEVVATDLSMQYVDNRADKVACNLFEADNPFTYFGQPDILLHLAWRDGFAHNSDTHINDLHMHYKFIKTMMESGIEKVSVMGSMHEVGFFEGSIQEDTPCQPMSLYGIGKNALRNIVQLLASQYKVDFQWLRGYYIVGNSHFGNSVFSKITATVQEGKTEFPFTMGQNKCDFIDYDIFCEQVAVTVEQNKINGIINMGSGKPEKLADRVERFIKENNYNIKLKYGAFPDRPYDSKAIWGDGTKLQAILAASHYEF